MHRQQYKISIHLSAFVTFVAMICFLASCTTVNTHRLYEGQQLSDDKIALLISKGDTILVHSVDGMKSPDGKETYGPSKFELLPGNHTLIVSFRRDFAVERGRAIIYYRSSSANNLVVRVGTEAGHTYLLTSQRDDERQEWYAVVMDETQKRKIVEEGPQPYNTVQTYVVTPPTGR